MPEKSTDQKNTPPGVNPTAPWRLRTVKVLRDYTLQVTFNDGTQGIVEMHDFVVGSEAGIFAALQDAAIFEQVHLEYGVVTWPGDIDLSPDRMYDEIKKKGKWVL
jgi:Protein of unknown function (DUF2442)